MDCSLLHGTAQIVYIVDRKLRTIHKINNESLYICKYVEYLLILSQISYNITWIFSKKLHMFSQHICPHVCNYDFCKIQFSTFVKFVYKTIRNNKKHLSNLGCCRLKELKIRL